MSAVFDIKEHTIEASHIREYPHALSHSQEDVLQLHIRQYTPKDNQSPRKGDITIIGGHANGFPKELYEPLWEDLNSELKKKGLRIRSIWMADTAWQGKSGQLNADKLGDDPGWYDYSRDIIHMINTFRPPRPLIGAAHSFGANALVHASLLHPRLFTSLILYDPVISRLSATPEAIAKGPAGMSVYRREVWPSRKAAEAAFRKSKFYKKWDERALKRWIEHGVRDLDSGEVTLSTTKHQEVFTFLRPSWQAYDDKGEKLIRKDLAPDLDETLAPKYPTWPLYRPEGPLTSSRLPNVRPGVMYVFGGDSNLSLPELRKEKLDTTGTGIGGSGGTKAGRVTQFTCEGVGHLIPLEAPGLCAEKTAAWIETEIKVWQREEDEFQAWAKKPAAEKNTISEERKRYMALDTPGKGPSKL